MATVGYTGTWTKSQSYVLSYEEPMEGLTNTVVVYFAKTNIEETLEAQMMLFPKGTIQFSNAGFRGETSVTRVYPLDFFYPVSKNGVGFPLKIKETKRSSSYTSCVPRPEQGIKCEW